MIRAATLADAARLADMHAACFEAAWDKAAMRLLLADSTALMSEEGFILARAVLDEAEVLSIGVLPASRGKGVGAALLAAAIDALRADGVGRIFLEVSDRNASARALYARHGFAEIGRRSAYYSDGADARVLSLSLA